MTGTLFGEDLVHNPDGLCAASAVEIYLEGGAVIGLEMIIVAMVAASPILPGG